MSATTVVVFEKRPRLASAWRDAERRLPIRLREARTLADAESTIQSNPFPILVVDFAADPQGSLTLLDSARRRDSLTIVVGSPGDWPEAAELRERGATAILQPPISDRQWLALIDRLVAHARRLALEAAGQRDIKNACRRSS